MLIVTGMHQRAIEPLPLRNSAAASIVLPVHGAGLVGAHCSKLICGTERAIHA